MTINATEILVTYTGNASQVNFDFDFTTYDEADLYVLDFEGNPMPGTSTVLNLDQDNDPGGTVTFDTAPDNAVVFDIIRIVPFEQQTEYDRYGPFPAKTHERALDELTMQTQQLGYKNDRQDERMDNIQDEIDTIELPLEELELRVTQNEIDISGNRDSITALESSRLTAVLIQNVNHSRTSLGVDATNNLSPEIFLQPAVGTKEPFTLVKLDADGLIPREQLPLGGAFTSRGVFTTVTDPAPADNPTIRNPGETYVNGNVFTIAVPDPQPDGAVLVINEDTGLPETVRMENGDALVYVEAVGATVEGWYALYSAGAGGAILAPDVVYDPAGNLIIDPASINVDAALTDLDAAYGTAIADKERVGTVKLWPVSTIPDGWLECDGAGIDSVMNPQLQALVDVLNPGGNTTAVLPETRGEFVRGWDNTRGVDAARALLSAQAEDLGPHTHTAAGVSTFAGAALPTHQHGSGHTIPSSYNSLYSAYGVKSVGTTGLGGSPLSPGNTPLTELISPGTPAGTVTTTVTVNATLGLENRPRNTAMIYIIKAYEVATAPQPPEYQITLTNKNYIINPTFRINQRAFPGGNSQDTYTFDRWKSVDVVGVTVSLPDVSGFVTISNVGSDLFQYIEHIGVEGVMTLSWEGTATGGIAGDGGGVGAVSPYTFDTAGLWDGGSDVKSLTVLFTNGTLKNAKLEVGSVATPFEYPDTATELAKCQRYYQTLVISYTAGRTAAAPRVYMGFPVTMRIPPFEQVVTAYTDVDASGLTIGSFTVSESGISRINMSGTLTESYRLEANVAMGAEL